MPGKDTAQLTGPPVNTLNRGGLSCKQQVNAGSRRSICPRHRAVPLTFRRRARAVAAGIFTGLAKYSTKVQWKGA